MKGNLSSYEGLRRIPKKILIFLMVAVGHLIDLMMGGASNYVRDVVIFFYIVNELISIIENTGSAGLPIPPIIKKTVKLLKAKKDNSE